MDKMAWRLGLVHSAGEAGPVPSSRGTGSRGSDAPTPATAKAAAHLASAPLHGRHVSSTPRQSGRGGMALRGGGGVEGLNAAVPNRPNYTRLFGPRTN